MFEVFLAWKVAWSWNNYRGWDHRSYREWVMGRGGRFLYVRKHGFGHEWWNFYEGFHPDYYFGYAPPIHSMRPRNLIEGGVIYFISKYPLTSRWFLRGVYGGVRILNSNNWISGPLIKYVPEEYRNELLDVTLKEMEKPETIGTYPYLLMAEKKLSTSLPKPLPLTIPNDLGVQTTGRWFFRYLSPEHGMKLLDMAIEYVKDLENMGETMNPKPSEVLTKLKVLRNHVRSLLKWWSGLKY